MAEVLVGCGHARVAELHATVSTALRILLQKARISKICYANDNPLFLHPAISPRNTLEICECRRPSGATTPSGHGTAAFPRPSRAENSGLCATPIPNRTFATPYVSRPFLSHVRSRCRDAPRASTPEDRSRVRPPPYRNRTNKPSDDPSYVRKADGEFEARLVALSCAEPPQGHSQWSLRLLADRVVELGHIDSVSHETVRRVLKKTQSSRGGASAG